MSSYKPVTDKTIADVQKAADAMWQPAADADEGPDLIMRAENRILGVSKEQTGQGGFFKKTGTEHTQTPIIGGNHPVLSALLGDNLKFGQPAAELDAAPKAVHQPRKAGRQWRRGVWDAEDGKADRVIE